MAYDIIKKTILLMLIYFLLTTLVMADSVVYVTSDGKKEKVEGTITKASFEDVTIKDKQGKSTKVPTENILSINRDSSLGLLAKAKAKSSMAQSSTDIKEADKIFEKIKKTPSVQLWEKEQATVLQFNMWVKKDPQKAFKVADELNKLNPKSFHLRAVWQNAAKSAFNSKNSKNLKIAVQKLRPLGALGRNQANYFDAEILHSSGDLKNAERKHRTIFKQLETNRSRLGRQLWLDAGTRYAQILIKQEKIPQAQEVFETIGKHLDDLDDRGHGLYHTLQGDILRLREKKAESLYAYMRVIVQYPNDLDLNAHCLQWAIKMSKELKYDDTTKKLEAELEKKHPNLKTSING